MKAHDRDEQILRACAKLVQSGACYKTITREQLATAVGCAEGLINYRFGTMDRLRSELMHWAVRHHELSVIAQGLTHGCKIARRAPWNVLADARELI